MAEQQSDLETMTCEQLLQALAELSSEGDQLNAEVATPTSAADQDPRVGALVETRARMDRITQLLRDKGCQGT